MTVVEEVGAAARRPRLPSRLSPSALGRYRSCPRSFLLTDIERVPRGGEASPILVQGNAVHHALERFFGLPPTDRQPENLERALRAVWPEHRVPGAFSTKEEEANFGREAIAMLHGYAERFGLDSVPLAREQWVQLRHGGLQLFGKLDRIDRAPSGGLDLTDYKCGRRLIDVADVPNEPAVQVYALAAEAQFQLPVERFRFIYLALGEEVRWEPEREDIEMLRERLSRTIEAIRQDEEFEAIPGDRCRFCPAALHCADRQRVELNDLVPVENLPF